MWEQGLLQLVVTVGLPGRVLIQLKELYPSLFAKDLAEIEKSELERDDEVAKSK